MPDLSKITPVTRLEEFIDRISRGGGGALPEVTSTDEGKVLTVVDNEGTYEWGAAAPGGSAIILYSTEDVPPVSGLPTDIPEGAEWEANTLEDAIYVSYTSGGTALTYGEIKNVYDSAKNGTPVIYVIEPEPGIENFYPTTLYSIAVILGEEDGTASISMTNYEDTFAAYNYKYTIK